VANYHHPDKMWCHVCRSCGAHPRRKNVDRQHDTTASMFARCRSSPDCSARTSVRWICMPSPRRVSLTHFVAAPWRSMQVELRRFLLLLKRRTKTHKDTDNFLVTVGR
jgi:hypothetical protein